MSHLRTKLNTGRKFHRIKSQGFTLMEVLVSVTIVAIGLLGLAKLQAASVSSTQASRVRSLVALQAESMVGAMRANRAYWASGSAPASWTASGGVVTEASGVLSAANIDCSGTNICTSPQFAAYDAQNWALDLNSHFPGMNATVTCSVSVAAPISCAIQLAWSENIVAMSAATAASAPVGPLTRNFLVLVQP